MRQDEETMSSNENKIKLASKLSPRAMKITVALFQFVPAVFFLWMGPRAAMSTFESMVLALLWIITITLLFIEANLRTNQSD